MIDNKIQEMQIIQRWTDGTTKQVRIAVHSYEAFHKTSFEKLLIEAEEDEQKIIKLQKRRIKKRLLQYLLYMREEKYADSTIRLYLAKIKQVYLYHDIEIPRLPSITIPETESYKDIPTPKEIMAAINNSRTKMKATITFLASSGLRRSDMAALTLNDFFEATREYHHLDVIHDEDIPRVVADLQRYEDIIPTFYITSEKTNTSHFAFCSSESVQFICQMLRERIMKKQLRLDDKLFDVRDTSVTRNFERLNDRLEFGWKETRRKFHPHSLRKFFATTLAANDVDYLSTEFLLGHRLSSVQSSYYFANPEKLRLKYSRVMPNLCFVTRIHDVDIVSSERRELSRLRDENKETRERLYELEEMINMLRMK